MAGGGGDIYFAVNHVFSFSGISSKMRENVEKLIINDRPDLMLRQKRNDHFLKKIFPDMFPQFVTLLKLDSLCKNLFMSN